MSQRFEFCRQFRFVTNKVGKRLVLAFRRRRVEDSKTYFRMELFTIFYLFNFVSWRFEVCRQFRFGRNKVGNRLVLAFRRRRVEDSEPDFRMELLTIFY